MTKVYPWEMEDIELINALYRLASSERIDNTDDIELLIHIAHRLSILSDYEINN